MINQITWVAQDPFLQSAHDVGHRETQLRRVLLLVETRSEAIANRFASWRLKFDEAETKIGDSAASGGAAPLPGCH
jgi:hypothetical protein